MLTSYLSYLCKFSSPGANVQLHHGKGAVLLVKSIDRIKLS